MSVQPNNFEIFDSFRHPVKTGMNPSLPFGTSKPRTDMPTKDLCEFSGGMGENLKFNEEKSRNGAVWDGTLNNKNTSLKVLYTKHPDKNITGYYEGYIGDKKLVLKIDVNTHRYTGTYGDKPVDFSINYNRPNKVKNFFQTKIMGKHFIPDYFDLNGTIGNNNVSYHLPDMQVPQDEDCKDMLSFAMFTRGISARTFNNQIVEVGFSNSSLENLEKAENAEKINIKKTLNRLYHKV